MATTTITTQTGTKRRKEEQKKKGDDKKNKGGASGGSGRKVGYVENWTSWQCCGDTNHDEGPLYEDNRVSLLQNLQI